ncbi:MAG: helix-turn-helix domain-containing protein [Nitrospinales bacterium]
MTNPDRLIDAKISILQLARELNNIQKACKVAGIDRSSFYETRKACELFRRQGLRPKLKRRSRMPNETSPEVVGSGFPCFTSCRLWYTNSYLQPIIEAIPLIDWERFFRRASADGGKGFLIWQKELSSIQIPGKSGSPCWKTINWWNCL